jgi:outer membrane protein OmpA-like peptidoglycan-associated protein
MVGAQTITVYFDFNSFMLTNDTRNSLNKFISSGKITSVGFFGHTDQMGSAEFNEWLSVQRALAVRDYFISKGIKEANIVAVRGFGAERLITDQPDSASRQLNRRVTITNDYKPTSTDIAITSRQTKLYYTISPSKKPVTDSSAMVLIEETKQPQPSTQTNTTPAVKENTASITNTPVKQVEASVESKPIAKAKRAPESTTKVDEKKPANSKQEKSTTDTKEALASNTPDATKEAVKQPEPSGETKESFADRLSKAVSKPTAKTATTKSSGTNTAAPVVKQQKHEKLIEDIKDKTTKEGEHIVLRHINFYGGRHAFLPQAYPALDDLLETMQKIPTLQIEIQGHICCQEGEGDQTDFDTGESNLSVTRAKAVYDFLIENGIDAKRMKYVGLAHKFPIIKVEATEEDATTNRRVEIKIIKK